MRPTGSIAFERSTNDGEGPMNIVIARCSWGIPAVGVHSLLAGRCFRARPIRVR